MRLITIPKSRLNPCCSKFEMRLAIALKLVCSWDGTEMKESEEDWVKSGALRLLLRIFTEVAARFEISRMVSCCWDARVATSASVRHCNPTPRFEVPIKEGGGGVRVDSDRGATVELEEEGLGGGGGMGNVGRIKAGVTSLS